MSLTTVTVTGKWARPDGTVPTGRVTFSPTSAMQNAGDDQFVVSAVEAALDAQGEISVDLYATDDADTSPADATYTVTEWIDGTKRQYEVEINAAAGTVDLADLAQATSTGSVAYALQSGSNIAVIDGGTP